jgi:hypothetical protein
MPTPYPADFFWMEQANIASKSFSLGDGISRQQTKLHTNFTAIDPIPADSYVVVGGRQKRCRLMLQ